MGKGLPPVETTRLKIMELHGGLAGSVHAGSLDADNRKYMPDEVFETVKAAQEAIAALVSCYGRREEPQVYAVMRSGGTHIGHVEAVPLGGGEWEIGYHIFAPHTEKGYACEAVAAFLPHIMRHLHIDRIHGICDADNRASRRVLERCGFRHVSDSVGPYHGRQALLSRYVYEMIVKPARQ